MGFFRQEYWSELSCPPLGDLPGPEMEPESHVSYAGRQVLPLAPAGNIYPDYLFCLCPLGSSHTGFAIPGTYQEYFHLY